jgi:hypothetical protein
MEKDHLDVTVHDHGSIVLVFPETDVLAIGYRATCGQKAGNGSREASASCRATSGDL